MTTKSTQISSGVDHLDRLLGGLFIGDNVIWYDDAGSLASAFSMNFIQTSRAGNHPLIYVSFDRSPKNLLSLLGPLAEHQHLTILDCFTNGKGDGSEVFTQFYEKNGAQWPYQVIKINDPAVPGQVMEAVERVYGNLKTDVRFVFESLTGMQDLWGGEEQIVKFYTHTCPRLYEMNTIAYWVIEKGAHSDRLKAHINQIAQVAIDLSIKRGKSALTILKAEKRSPDALNKPQSYWSRGTEVCFDTDNRSAAFDIGQRLKELRTRQGLSQTELARLVGVTPSTISQIESNIISPSLAALVKMAETLSVEIASFFQHHPEPGRRVVFSPDEGVEITFPDLPKNSIRGMRFTPADMEPMAEPFIIEIPAGKTLNSHFFMHKGEETGYLISGSLQTQVHRAIHTLNAGDIIHLTTDIPAFWKNTGTDPARLLWLKIKP